MNRFRLKDKEFWLEVVNINDNRIDVRGAIPIKASYLSKIIAYTDIRRVLITPTSQVLVRLVFSDMTLSESTYIVPYRPFVGFMSTLFEIDPDISLDWKEFGF